MLNTQYHTCCIHNTHTYKSTGNTPNHYKTRSTQRAQTSMAEADHYSHIVHCKNVEPWLWKTTHPPKKIKIKVLDHYLHHDLGMLPLLRCFFAHLLILQYPDHHQTSISSCLYYSGPVHKISSQSIHNFLSNVHRQTNRQTDTQLDKLTNATKNITSIAKEVINMSQVDNIIKIMIEIHTDHQTLIVAPKCITEIYEMKS